MNKVNSMELECITYFGSLMIQNTKAFNKEYHTIVNEDFCKI